MSKAAIQARERLIIGPYLVAVNIQGIFYGILLAQWWWICVKARRRPSGRMHALLATLVLLNTLQCGCDIHVGLSTSMVMAAPWYFLLNLGLL